MKNFWQKWTVQPLGEGNVHVVLEGFFDPAGNIPAWLYNNVITETPVKAIHSLRERALSNKPVKK